MSQNKIINTNQKNTSVSGERPGENIFIILTWPHCLYVSLYKSFFFLYSQAKHAPKINLTHLLCSYIYFFRCFMLYSPI